MNLRSLARGATLTAAVLLLAAPAATTVHAAEAPACAKEQLSYLNAEDKATAADKDADAAQAAFEQSERDRATLRQTVGHLYDLTHAMDSLTSDVAHSGHAKQAQLNEMYKERRAAEKAANAAYKALEADDAAGVAAAAEEAAAAAKRFLTTAKDLFPSYYQVKNLAAAIEEDAAAARKATTAKDYDTLKDKAQQSRTSARTANDAVPTARSELKTCLTNATK